MSSYRRWTAFIMTALLFSGTAAAQSPGTLMVGGFGQYTHFDSKWNLDTGFGNSLGFGLRFGGYFAPGWNLEGDGSYTPATSNPDPRFLGSPNNVPGGPVKASALTFRLVRTFPSTSTHSFHIGGGGVLENFRDSVVPRRSTYQLGLNGLAGVNVVLGGLVLRVDGFGNYLPSANGKFDFGLQAGLQFSPDISTMFRRGPKPATASPAIWSDSLGTPVAGTLELGGFLQYTHFGDSAGRVGANPKSGVGFGGRAGVFLMDPRWEIEWDGYYGQRQ